MVKRLDSSLLHMAKPDGKSKGTLKIYICWTQAQLMNIFISSYVRVWLKELVLEASTRSKRLRVVGSNPTTATTLKEGWQSWFNALVSKTRDRLRPVRGFESHTFLQFYGSSPVGRGHRLENGCAVMSPS